MKKYTLISLLQKRTKDFALIEWVEINKLKKSDNTHSFCYSFCMYSKIHNKRSNVSIYDIIFHPRSNFLRFVAREIKLNMKDKIKIVYSQELVKKLKYWCIKSESPISYVLDKVNNTTVLDIYT